MALAERGVGRQGGLETLAGDGLMLVTALCGAAYAVLARRAFARYGALTVTTYAMVLGTLLLLPFGLAERLVEHSHDSTGRRWRCSHSWGSSAGLWASSCGRSP